MNYQKAIFSVFSFFILTEASARDMSTTCFKIDDQPYYLVTGSTPGTTLALYSQRCGGICLQTAKADNNGEALIPLEGKDMAAFVLSRSSTGIGNKKVVFTNPPVFTFSSLHSGSGQNGHYITWAAQGPSSISFLVSRSEDGKTYKQVAEIPVKAEGIMCPYTFTDDLQAPAWFQITIIGNKDGDLYKTLPILLGYRHSSNISVYPTKASNTLNVLVAKEDANARCTVVNAMGQIVLRPVLNGKNTPISISSLAAGSYYFYLSGVNGKSIAQFQKL